MGTTAIRMENLTRDFPAVRAVDGLTLEVPAGSIFGFLGPNGSGKTTTIRLLLGLLAATTGRAEVLGFDTLADADRLRERVGALLEHPGLYERLSAEENLDYYGRIYRLPPRERQARIKELLTPLGLWDRRQEGVRTWSRGMKQKLAVARALLHRPSLIFLDEPTAGLDPVAAAELREDLTTLVAREGTTIFLTTHLLFEAEKLCSQVGVIRAGRLLAVGSPGELKARAGGPTAEIVGSGFQEEMVRHLGAMPGVETAALREGRLVIAFEGELELGPLVAYLVGAGARVEEARKNTATLEEAFLALLEEER